MKTPISKFVLLIISVCSITFSNAQVPGMIILPDVGRAAAVKILADGNMLCLFTDIMVKMNPEGDILWVQDGGNYVFEMADASLITFDEDGLTHYTGGGEMIDAVPFYLGDMIAVCQIASGFEILRVAGGHFELSRIMNDGTELWSYDLPYDYYEHDKTFMLNSGENTHIFINWYVHPYWGHSFESILVDTFGSVLSVVNHDTTYLGDVMDNGENLYYTYTSHYEELRLGKVDYDNEDLWNAGISLASEDSVAVLLQLPSGNIVVAYRIGYDHYQLTYLTASGEYLFTTPEFLDAEHYVITDMAYLGGNSIAFIGNKDYDEGFVLITDTLGTFIHMNVTGRLYEDINTNGVYDAGEIVFHDIIVSAPPYYAASNAEGYYNLFLPEEGEHTINASFPAYWDIVDPSSGYAVTVDDAVSGDTLLNNDFRFSYSEPITNLVASTYIGVWASGYPVEGGVWLHNYGNQYALSGTVTYHYPAGLTVVYTEPPFDTHEDTILSWNYSGFNAYGFQSFYVQFSSDFDPGMIGDTVYCSALAEPVAGDYFPADNEAEMQCIVSASYDPNHKTVTPAGTTDEGFTDPSTVWLTYTIEFQNTGTSEAINISVIDTLNENLSFTALQMLGSSHNYTMEILGYNIVKWNFTNINLPDSTTDFLASNGFIQFRVNINDLPEGTVIRNTAYIYFDFNPAVQTNTTVTTLKDVSSGNSDPEYDAMLRLYPNPSGGTFIIDISQLKNRSNNTFVSIRNMIGEEVYIVDLDHPQNMYLITLDKTITAGAYIVEVKNGENSFSRRLIVSE